LVAAAGRAVYYAIKPEAAIPNWLCPACKTENGILDVCCRACRKPRPLGFQTLGSPTTSRSLIDAIRGRNRSILDEIKVDLGRSFQRSGSLAGACTGQVSESSKDELERPGLEIPKSTDGRGQPAWNPDGSELYFLGVGNKMMVVDITTRPSFVAGKPRVLFDLGQHAFGATPVRGYDTDGKRFVAFARKQDLEASPVTQINIVLNWFEELKRLVPAGKK